MGGRTMPTECRHGRIIDWGDFGPDDPEHCPDCESRSTTHSEDCWQWHPTCAQQRIPTLLDQVDEAREEAEVYRAVLHEVWGTDGEPDPLPWEREP